ncbi:MAG: Uma2 family endonuclease [Longimicrobiales bacterium]
MLLRSLSTRAEGIPLQTSGSDRLINIEEYERLPDTNESVELLRGRLIREPRPAYGHGALQARLAHRLTEHIEQGKLPMVCGTDFGCRLTRNPDSVLAPDVAVARLFRDARWWRCTSRVPRPDSRFVHLVGRSRYGFGSVDRETGAGAGGSRQPHHRARPLLLPLCAPAPASALRSPRPRPIRHHARVA